MILRLFVVLSIATPNVYAAPGPRVPRAAFACAELLAGAPGEVITTENVAAEFSSARTRLKYMVELVRTGKVPRPFSWFGEFNPHHHGALHVAIEDREEFGHARELEAAAVRRRLNMLERDIQAGPDVPRSPAHAWDTDSTARIVLSRAITGRDAVLSFLTAFRDGVGAREAAHPGYVETPPRRYTDDQLAEKRVGLFGFDLTHSALHAFGTLGLAVASAVIGYEAIHLPAYDWGHILATIVTAGMSAVQSTWFADTLAPLKISARTYVENARRIKMNAIRRTHEGSVARTGILLNHVDAMIQSLSGTAERPRILSFHEFDVHLPIGAPEFNGPRGPVDANVIEALERAPQPTGAMMNRVFKLTFMFVDIDGEVPSLKVFVRESRVLPRLHHYGAWPGDCPF